MNDDIDIKQQRELDLNAVRVLVNGLILLDIGLFPGKHAVGLEEFKSLVVAVKTQTEARMNEVKLAPPPPPVAA